MKTKKIAIPLLLVLTLLMSSCGIYGSYKRPESITTERLFREVESTDTASIAQIPWHSFFSDPYLISLIEQGLERNADLRIAQLTLEQAKASQMTAGLSLLPNLGFSPKGQHTYVQDQGWGNRTYTLPITASWQVDLFGTQTSTYRQAGAQKRLAEAQVQSVQTNIIAAIANSYYTLLMLDEQVRIAEETKVLWSESLRTMQALKQAGMVTEAAVAQSEAQAYEVQNTLITLHQQIREVENALSTLLHEPPQAIARGSFNEQTPLPAPRVGIPVQLLANRPDIRAAEEAVAVAYYGANRARGAFLPGVTISATGSWVNSLGELIVDPLRFVGTAVASLFQPIFNNGRNIAQLRIAKAQQEQATIRLQQSLLDAGAEVSNLLYSYNVSQEKVSAREAQVASLERARDTTTKLMSLGNSNYLEVITAQQQLLGARLGLVSDRFVQMQSAINLYKALGGGHF